MVNAMLTAVLAKEGTTAEQLLQLQDDPSFAEHQRKVQIRVDDLFSRRTEIPIPRNRKPD
jgi:hypothetical protein